MLAHKESIYYYSIVFMFKLCVGGILLCDGTYRVCVKLQLSFFRNYPHYLPYFWGRVSHWVSSIRLDWLIHKPQKFSSCHLPSTRIWIISAGYCVPLFYLHTEESNSGPFAYHTFYSPFTQWPTSIESWIFHSVVEV